MTPKEQKKAAKDFAERWKGKGYEKGQSQQFWIDLLVSVFGVEDIALFLSILYRAVCSAAFVLNTTQSNIVVLQDQFLHKKNLSHISGIKIDLSKTL